MPATIKTIGRAKIKVSEVNLLAKKDAKAFFDFCNGRYEKKLDSIADRIAADPSKARLIMLSGPSASGKTTTSLKIQEKLKNGAAALSRFPWTISSRTGKMRPCCRTEQGIMNRQRPLIPIC